MTQQPVSGAAIEKAQPILDMQLTRAPALRAAILDQLYDHKIKDVLLRHQEVSFDTMPGGILAIENIRGEDKGSYFKYRVHKHALNQIAVKVHVPMTYATMLLAHKGWGAELLSHDLTEIYRKVAFRKQEGEDKKFLLRVVRTEVRGFLSSRYALHLSTDPLLVHFLDYCLEQNAVPVEIISSDVRISVKCVLSQVFEPFPGQAICVGMTFHNSDFGAGTFTVSNAIWDPVRGIGMTFGAAQWDDKRGDLFNRVHLGPLLREEDMTTVTSERAARTAQVARLMRQEISKELESSRVQRILDAVQYASTKNIVWTSLRKNLYQSLRQNELTALKDMLKHREPTLPTLPIDLDDDGLPVPTYWWAASAVSMLAKSVGAADKDRALDLQHVAGRLIDRE